jgi:trimeric autotransporter adhesin
LIGTDRTGTRALSNSNNGITFGSSGFTTVGGAEAGAGNLISGNGDTGVGGNGGAGSGARNGVVQGNFIGTDVTGTRALGNGNGVAVLGNVTLAQNLIEFNANQGVYAAGNSNLITNNTIAFNGSTGVSATGGNLISHNA